VTTGTRIGAFEIVGPLGAGGMGEVYRARDLRLHRDVALKILPASFALDTGRRARFEREARVLASLGHPNIATLYGVEQTPIGQALVMELVEGTTLADRLALASRGVADLTLRDALAIAQQIAAALEGAHAHGVVHRDLKPANIVVRPDGTVKVLDFGLAKTIGGAAAGAEERATRVTLTDAGPGMGPGTPAYMSPEQVRGMQADTRTDIWAFGCVLYELLTRQRAFAGDHPSDVAARILEREPDFTTLPPGTPSPIRRLVERCLAKDSNDRLRDIGDARLELRDALAGNSGIPAAAANPRVTQRTVWQAAGVVALAALAGLAGWWVAMRTAPRDLNGVVRLSIPAMEPPFRAPFGEPHLSISDDGSQVAYASADRLWIRRLDQKDTVAIDGSASNPFFSPDGEWVAYFARSGPLMKVSVHGGAPVPIAAYSGRPMGGTWRADGTIVFATTEGLYQVADRGGHGTLLIKPDAARKERAYGWPQFIPDSQAVLFTIVPEGAIEGAQIAVLDLKARTSTVVLRAGSAGRYVSTGHLVYASGRTLNAIVFDRRTLRSRGQAVSLGDVQVAGGADNGAADFAVSDAGTLVFIAPYAAGPALSALWWVDRRGKEELLPLVPGPYAYPRVSPDGSRVALDIPGTNRDIWVWNTQRPGLTRLTSGPAEDMLPTWGRNGRLFFASQRNGNFDVYSQASDGATPERVEFAGPGDQMPGAFTPDGTAIMVNENFKDLSVLKLGPSPRLTPLLHTDANEWLGEVSPDGNWIAYESDESGDRVEVFVRPFADPTARREKVSMNGGRYPTWAPDGTGELFFVDPDGAMMAAGISLSPTLVLGGVKKLFDLQRPARGVSGRPYDVSPRDGRFLVLRPVVAGTNPRIDLTVVLNWSDELRRLVPAR
jgi:eukaryotic-like serine/threonine-protein kinase